MTTTVEVRTGDHAAQITLTNSEGSSSVEQLQANSFKNFTIVSEGGRVAVEQLTDDSPHD